MLIPWPLSELLFLGPLAAFLIRVALACVFAWSAKQRVSNGTGFLIAFGIIDGLIAIALFLGLYTQIAALAGFVCTIAWLLKPSWNPYPRSTTMLAAVMCASLLVLGPGPFAFDLPL
jgi:hypothetical protein